MVVVGSGITGTSVAWHLLNEGRGGEAAAAAAAGGEGGVRVVMLEAREACWGATGRVSFSCSLFFLFFFCFPLRKGKKKEKKWKERKEWDNVVSYSYPHLCPLLLFLFVCFLESAMFAALSFKFSFFLKKKIKKSFLFNRSG